LRGLAELDSLRELRLDFTSVTDTGLEVLAGLKGLQALHLGGTKVTDAGVTQLQKALPKCRIYR
jgi:hypothetical protein